MAHTTFRWNGEPNRFPATVRVKNAFTAVNSAYAELQEAKRKLRNAQDVLQEAIVAAAGIEPGKTVVRLVDGGNQPRFGAAGVRFQVSRAEGSFIGGNDVTVALTGKRYLDVPDGNREHDLGAGGWEKVQTDFSSSSARDIIIEIERQEKLGNPGRVAELRAELGRRAH